jgi:hypothetical protein
LSEVENILIDIHAAKVAPAVDENLIFRIGFT